MLPFREELAYFNKAIPHHTLRDTTTKRPHGEGVQVNSPACNPETVI